MQKPSWFRQFIGVVFESIHFGLPYGESWRCYECKLILKSTGALEITIPMDPWPLSEKVRLTPETSSYPTHFLSEATVRLDPKGMVPWYSQPHCWIVRLRRKRWDPHQATKPRFEHPIQPRFFFDPNGNQWEPSMNHRPRKNIYLSGFQPAIPHS